MYRVQIRDAADPSKVLVKTFPLPYDPHDGSEIRVRLNAKDQRHTGFQIIKHLYEAVVNDPHESGFALLVRPI